MSSEGEEERKLPQTTSGLNRARANVMTNDGFITGLSQ